MPRAFTIAVLAAALAASVLAPAASANGNLDIGTRFSPSVAASFTTNTSSLTFSVTTTCPGLGAFVEIARDEQYDPDGTLFEGVQVDRFALDEVTSGVYRGTSTGIWLQTPGAYYWQVSGVGACDGGNATLWVGPANGFTITSAPSTDPIPGSSVPDSSEILSLAQARAAIPTIVKNVTRRIARGLKRTCTRAGAGDLTVVLCTASWNDKLQYRYNGAFRMALNDDGTVSARFDGRRGSLACIAQRKGKNAKACYRARRFSYTL